MDLHVPAESFEGRGLVLRPAGVFHGPQLVMNGVPVRGKRRRYLLEDNVGRSVEAKLRPAFVDPIPRVEIDGHVFELAPRLKWYQSLWLGLPLLFTNISVALFILYGVAMALWNQSFWIPLSVVWTILGVLLGRFFGRAVVFAQVDLFRSIQNRFGRYVATAALGGFASTLCFLLILASLIIFHSTMAALGLHRPIASEQAVGFLAKRGMNLQEGSADWYTAQGEYYYEVGHLDKAIKYYRLAIEKDPKNPSRYNDLAYTYYLMSRYDEAIPIYEQSLALDPREKWALNQLGVIGRKQGRFEQAESYHQKALEADPQFAMAHSSYGKTLMENGKLDEAEKELRAAISLEPKNPTMIVNLGLYYEHIGRWDEAIDTFKKAIAVNPMRAEAYVLLGEALLKQKGSSGAKETYRKAVAARPTDPHIHADFGKDFAQAGMYPEAIQAFQAALKIDPNSHDYRWGLAMSYDEAGQYEKAIHEYQENIRRHGPSVIDYYHLGATYYHRKDAKNALAYFDKALALDPNEKDSLYWSADLLREAGQLDEASERLKRVIQIDPQHQDGYVQLARTYIDQKRLAEARETLEKSLTVNARHSWTHAVYGYLARQLGNPKEAISHYETALEIDPSYEAVRKALAEIKSSLHT